MGISFNMNTQSNSDVYLPNKFKDNNLQLENKNKTLIDEVNNLKNQPKSQPYPEVDTDRVVKTDVITFEFDKVDITPKQEIVLYNVVQSLKINNSKIVITGYADKNTGSSDINMKLSEKRAKNVASTLINKYQTLSENIIIQWKGSTEQVYSENDWNRIVIISE